MDNSNEIKRLVASFAEQVTHDRLEEARAVSGIGFLPPGTMTELLKDYDFSVDDLITLLLSGWMIQGKELSEAAKRVSELEDLCAHQQKAIDEIVDQSTKLKYLVAAMSPDKIAPSPIDMLKDIAARANTGDA